MYLFSIDKVHKNILLFLLVVHNSVQHFLIDFQNTIVYNTIAEVYIWEKEKNNIPGRSVIKNYLN